ncbi:MAG TPA: hypothetical protein VIS04_07650 [Woeseiaceae bacterium]
MTTNSWRLTLTMGAAILMSACSSEVALTELTIPKPLVAKMPMAVAVKYPANFDRYVYEEEIIGAEKWEIDLGSSNRKLFNSIFDAMFESVIVVTPEDELTSLAFDAYIEPEIDAFEFSIPAQSRTPAYAVWIRYRLRVFDASGTQVASWPVSAYGKTHGGKFGGSESLHRAAILAMRDAAAVIGIQMDKATGISKLRRGDALSAVTMDPVTTEKATAEQSATQTNAENGS